MNIYLFRTVPLPVIRNPLTVHLALVCVLQFEDSFQAGHGPAWKLSSNCRTHYLLTYLLHGAEPLLKS